jgi:urease accessory protein
LTTSQTNEPIEQLSLLKLLHVADCALPTGSAAHSSGLETLVAQERLRVDMLPEFLRHYLEETGVLESAFCRAAHRSEAGEWAELNLHLTARRLAYETRLASLTLGRYSCNCSLRSGGWP